MVTKKVVYGSDPPVLAPRSSTSIWQVPVMVGSAAYACMAGVSTPNMLPSMSRNAMRPVRRRRILSLKWFMMVSFRFSHHCENLCKTAALRQNIRETGKSKILE